MFGRDVLDVRRLHYPCSATNPTFTDARRADWLRRNWNKHPLGLVEVAWSNSTTSIHDGWLEGAIDPPHVWTRYGETNPLWIDAVKAEPRAV